AALTPEMLRKADLVLGMTPFHVQFALRMSDDARGKTFLLKEYTKSDLKNYQITDPMGATLEVYKRVFREIKLAIDKLVEMDAIHSPLTAPLVHEKWTPPTPVKAAPVPEPEVEEVEEAVEAPKAPEGKKASGKKSPGKKAGAG